MVIPKISSDSPMREFRPTSVESSSLVEKGLRARVDQAGVNAEQSIRRELHKQLQRSKDFPQVFRLEHQCV